MVSAALLLCKTTFKIFSLIRNAMRSFMCLSDLMFISMIASHVPSLIYISYPILLSTKSKVFSLGLIRSAKKADFIRMKAWCLAKTYKLFDEQTEQVLYTNCVIVSSLVSITFQCGVLSIWYFSLNNGVAHLEMSIFHSFTNCRQALIQLEG